MQPEHKLQVEVVIHAHVIEEVVDIHKEVVVGEGVLEQLSGKLPQKSDRVSALHVYEKRGSGGILSRLWCMFEDWMENTWAYVQGFVSK
jgi:hypothetical protein